VGIGWPIRCDLARASPLRISQTMGLLLLAPDMQEAPLFLPSTDGGRGVVGERTVRPIAAVLDRRK
jgi:hypothetical protein